jgi:hypothetical protein
VKSWRNLLLALALLAPAAVFAEPDQKPDAPKADKADKSDSKKKKDGKEKQPAKESSDQEKEDAVLGGIPDQQTFYGLRIPNFSPGGKLLMLFAADSAKRIDNRDIEMNGLKIEIHNDDGTTFHVEMAHSVFNLDTRILKSDTPTTIKRDDFTIEGQRAEFHTKERFGHMYGDVKMVIFNTGDDDSTTDKNSKSK